MNLLDQILNRETRDSTGLIGLKVLSVTSNGLVSPAQGTSWRGPQLTADNWSNEKAVRGVAGIHACWPWSPSEIMRYIMDASACTVEVRGYGDTVQGDIGWRSQHAIMQAIHCWPHQLVDIQCSPDGTLDSWYSEVPVLCDNKMIVHLLIDQLENREQEMYRWYRCSMERVMRRMKKQGLL